MNLTQYFQQSRRSPAFIPFIMAGHPDLKTTFQLILELEKIGVTAIEIGIPFSDPVADGPVNQKAAEIALQQGVTLNQCLEMIQSVREEGCELPIIIFSYLNPILHLGYENFATKAKTAGVDSVLVVDLPPEEAEALYLSLQQQQIGMIFLASPTTNPNRYTYYQKLPPVFIYYVSRLGVTGIQKNLPELLQQELAMIKQQLNFPVCAGFGISTPEQAHTIAQYCDGVIVGSALVNILEHSYHQVGVKAFLELAEEFCRGVGT
jgi:tryptophan synthase alpha chain